MSRPLSPGQAALRFAEQGTPVFPVHTPIDVGGVVRCSCRKAECDSVGKHPRTKQGLTDATTDTAIVGAWWDLDPNANIGLVTGEVSGLWVLDIDADTPGEVWFAAQVEEHGLPDTRTVRTGSGGTHLFWRHDTELAAWLDAERLDLPTRNTIAPPQGVPLKGLDVRATGGYVVAPPSLHRGGNRYEWLDSRPPVAAPEWLLRAVCRPREDRRAPAPPLPPALTDSMERKYGLACLRNACTSIASATEGERHVLLRKGARTLGGFIAAGYIGEEEAETALIDAGIASGKPHGEVRRTVRYGIENGKSHPLKKPPSQADLRAERTPRWRGPDPGEPPPEWTEAEGRPEPPPPEDRFELSDDVVPVDDAPDLAAPAPLDVLAVLADARVRLDAAATAKDRPAMKAIELDLLEPGFVHAVASSPARREALVALASLQVHGFTSSVRRVERAIQCEVDAIETAAETERRSALKREQRQTALAARSRAVEQALREEWPPTRKGPYPPVSATLDVNHYGNVRACHANAMKILRDDPRWGARIRLNRLGDQLEVAGVKSPDEHVLIADTTEWIGDTYAVQMGTETVRFALFAVAATNAYHPVRDYLEGLPPWDGTPRIQRLLTDALGVKSTGAGDSDKAAEFELYGKYIRRTLIAAVARVMLPGCKVDTALILVGEQGRRKSGFFEALFGTAWFGDSPITLGDKEAPLKMLSTWGYELAELETLSRHTAEQVKQFMTIKADRFRQLYEKNPRPWPRHSVLVGSTNKQEFLIDPTGSRRFWPVQLPDGVEIDLAVVREVRDQAWAEALAAYRIAAPLVAAGLTPSADHRWWLEREEDQARVKASEAHQVGDEWDDHVVRWLDERTHLSGAIMTSEVLVGAIKMDPDRMDDAARRRMGSVLRRLGFIQKRERIPRYGGYRSVWTRDASEENVGPRRTAVLPFVVQDAHGVPH